MNSSQWYFYIFALCFFLSGCKLLTDPLNAVFDAPFEEIVHRAANNEALYLYAYSIILRYGLYGQSIDIDSAELLRLRAINKHGYSKLVSNGMVFDVPDFEIPRGSVLVVDRCANELNKAESERIIYSRCIRRSIYEQYKVKWDKAKER